MAIIIKSVPLQTHRTIQRIICKNNCRKKNQLGERMIISSFSPIFQMYEKQTTKSNINI
jgi:hypothetical protein